MFIGYNNINRYLPKESIIKNNIKHYGYFERNRNIKSIQKHDLQIMFLQFNTSLILT